ncbi:hypothetical protein [Microbacterium luticocti]|uniref:hypothetical protein n=1 Tax=Microbacterium luticocti TaxID=451764 RepID=UPI00041FA0BC|nr:hypothetical protein [Microbacterium luticocti]
MPKRSSLPGVLAGVVGVVLAAWIAFGRALFGVAGSLTPVYALTLGLIYLLLHIFIAQALVRTARRGLRVRRATVGTLCTSWGCAVLLGLLIPDVTASGLQTIVSGASEPALGIAIGFANPAGVVMLVFAVIALVLARGDALGRADAPPEEDGY